MKEKIIEKVRSLLISDDKEISFLPSQEFSTSRMKIDKILVASEKISGFKNGEPTDWWEWQVYVDFQQHPILSGKDAEEVRDAILNGSENALEKYLEIPEYLQAALKRRRW